MFPTNMGKTDRIIRVVVGLALVLGFFLNPDGGLRWLYLLGLIPLVTGLIGTCPIYALFGISTCPTKQ